MDTSCESAGPTTDVDEPAHYSHSSDERDEIESLSDIEECFLRQLDENDNAKNGFRKQLAGILCRDHGSPLSTFNGDAFLSLSSSASKVSSLETELNQTKDRLELIKPAADGKTSSGPGNMDLANELKRLGSETEEFKKVGEAARAEVLRAMSEIELAKTRIEIRLVAAKKMKEAARAAETATLAEMKAMSNNENSSCGLLQQETEILSISYKEYSRLMSRASEAEVACQSKLASAMLQVDEANLSKAEILRKVEEAREEVQSSKKALEEALSKVENANSGGNGDRSAGRKGGQQHIVLPCSRTRIHLISEKILICRM